MELWLIVMIPPRPERYIWEKVEMSSDFDFSERGWMVIHI